MIPIINTPLHDTRYPASIYRHSLRRPTIMTTKTSCIDIHSLRIRFSEKDMAKGYSPTALAKHLARCVCTCRHGDLFWGDKAWSFVEFCTLFWQVMFVFLLFLYFCILFLFLKLEHELAYGIGVCNRVHLFFWEGKLRFGRGHVFAGVARRVNWR